MGTVNESRRTFKVCSFNIRNGDADDGPNSWPHRADTVVQFLRQIDADIFGLQEVMDYQLTYILKGLPDHSSIGVGRIDGQSEGEFAPILYKPAILNLVESGWFWLSEEPENPGSQSWDTACERICTWADFGDFQVFNTHLDHISAEARFKGTQLILSRMSDKPTILMGDLNVLPNDPTITAIEKQGFKDAISPVSQSTFHNWGTEEYGQIDYIFTRGFETRTPAILTNKLNARDASDHYPIVAKVQLSSRENP